MTDPVPRSSSTYKEALAWLYGTQLFGIKLGLENIERLLGALQLPAPGQKIIHVAGTNGKGSVCAMLDSILRAQGYRPGLFTSPHLVTFRERIQIDGEMISERELANGLTNVRALVHDWEPHPTFFEITTALALHHFAQQEVELVVLETGMGGRLDATNAVAPAVSVLTPIGLDHQKWLGSTLREIAAEKAGIIKPRVAVVSARQKAEAEAVIRARALACEASLRFVTSSYDAGKIALAGAHQKENAALAIAAIEAAEIHVEEEAIRRGLSSVTWPARFQYWDARTILDGAHNPAGAAVLAATWREAFGDTRATIILAVLRDKDAAGIVSALASIAERFILPRARSERALPPEDLALLVKKAAPNLPLEIAPSFSDVLLRVRPNVTLITGSLHFAGEALAHLRGEAEALENCAQ